MSPEDRKVRLQSIIDGLHDAQSRIIKYEAAIDANKRWMRRLEAQRIILEINDDPDE